MTWTGTAAEAMVVAQTEAKEKKLKAINEKAAVDAVMAEPQGE